ncbi:hypothetical protein NFI96_007528 [Prochilodus magdalenae]|nr:hypothetical protein NFI96_007528 [Prochilodus magdalenae]
MPDSESAPAPDPRPVARWDRLLHSAVFGPVQLLMREYGGDETVLNKAYPPFSVSHLTSHITRLLLTAVAALSAYSIHLLLKASGIVGIRAYEQLGYRAFGTPGKMAAGIAITLQNIGVCSLLSSLSCDTSSLQCLFSISQASPLSLSVSVTLLSLSSSSLCLSPQRPPSISMSSYLFIVKSEFPLVIQAFLKADSNSGIESVGLMSSGLRVWTYESADGGVPVPLVEGLGICMVGEWYLNGNYLVVLVTLSVILPLALMKQLGSVSTSTDGLGSTLRVKRPLYITLCNDSRNPEKSQSLYGEAGNLCCRVNYSHMGLGIPRSTVITASGNGILLQKPKHQFYTGTPASSLGLRSAQRVSRRVLWSEQPACFCGDVEFYVPETKGPRLLSSWSGGIHAHNTGNHNTV